MRFKARRVFLDQDSIDEFAEPVFALGNFQDVMFFGHARWWRQP